VTAMRGHIEQSFRYLTRYVSDAVAQSVADCTPDEYREGLSMVIARLQSDLDASNAWAIEAAESIDPMIDDAGDDE